MSNVTKYVRDAFKSLDLLEDTKFDLYSKEDYQALDDFINIEGDIDPDVNVFDLEATEPEELKDSYIGDVILECPVCHANIFKEMEEVDLDPETELCCVGVECPTCGNLDGFKVLGKVAPFEELPDEEEETEVEVETEPDEAEVEVEDKEEEEIKESFKRKMRKVLRESKEINETAYDVTDRVVVKTSEPGFIQKMHDLRAQGYKICGGGEGIMIFIKPKELVKTNPETGEVLESHKLRKGRKLKEEVSEFAYDIANKIEDRFRNETFISWDDFEESYYDFLPNDYIELYSDEDEDLKTDVRGIMSMDGWETIYEGDNEGGLRLVESKSTKEDEKLKEATEIKGLENAKNVADEFKNYAAYKANFKPLVITKQGKNYYVYKESAKESSDYIQFGNKDYIDGWLYGCVQSKMKVVENRKSRRNKNLTEAPIYDLNPRYDSRQSFYGKAKVDTGDKNDQNKLYSYNTLVAEIKDGKPVVYGTYSSTTLRHIKDWLKQNGFKAENSKQILADYGVKEECIKKEAVTESALKKFRENRKSLSEDIERAEIETTDQVITVSTDKKEEPFDEPLPESEEEMIAPLDDGDVSEIENNEADREEPEEVESEEEVVDEFPEDEDSFEFEGIQKDSFNRIIENYIKKNYSNVESFEIENVKSNKTQLQLEGKITFKSGSENSTTFMFERVANKDSIAKNRARYVGLNEKFTSKKNAYVLRVSLEDKKLVAESLRYNYPAIASNLNEAIKTVKGFVK